MTGPFSLASVLTPARVLLLDVTTKNEALDALVDCLAAACRLPDRKELADGIRAREKLMSTGIGLGVGVPHVRLESISALTMAAAVSRRDIPDYESLDNRPVRLVFMIAAGAGQHAEHLRALAAIGARVKDASLRAALLAAPDAAAFHRLLTRSGG